MKSFLIYAGIFLLQSFWCCAQNFRAVAVSSAGVLMNNSTDSITGHEARNISALNALVTDAKKNPFRGKVTAFKMSVYDQAGGHVFDSSSEMLTPEMKEQLQKIQPGNKLYFEYIRTEMLDGSHPFVPALGFTIR